MKALRIVSLSLVGPLLSLWGVDRALVSSDELWTWVAREVPRRVADPYLVEGTIRSATPGPENIVVLGNSRADDGIDADLLDRELGHHNIRALNLTVAGTSLLHQAFVAPQVATLDSGLALLVLDAVALADPNPASTVWSYDRSVASEVFGPAASTSSPPFT